jgi:glycosyltransferase involved in cell wall biosynthesis
VRILHVLHQYMPDHIGGTELYTKSIAQRQVQDGHEAAVFVPASSSASGKWPEATDEEGVRIFRFDGLARSSTLRLVNTFTSRSIKRAFEQVVTTTQPDVVHVQHLMGLPADIIDTISNHGIPFVLTLHDYWYICANAQLLTNYDNTICGGPQWWINCARCGLARMDIAAASFISPLVAPLFAARDRLVKKALEGAKYLIAPTPFVRQIYGGQGTDIDKIVVIPHGIDLPDKTPKRRERRRDELHVGYVGGLSWQKGVHVLIEAFNDLPEEGTTLSIWGDQDAFPRYVNELRELAQHKGIAFKGLLAREQFWSVLSEFDVVVVPSLWYETASLIIQESFAVGVPVVASDLGALATRVENGKDGLLVPPDNLGELTDTLRKLKVDADLLQHLQSGIQPVYTISEHASEIERLYKLAMGT